MPRLEPGRRKVILRPGQADRVIGLQLKIVASSSLRTQVCGVASFLVPGGFYSPSPPDRVIGLQLKIVASSSLRTEACGVVSFLVASMQPTPFCMTTTISFGN
jgi:hypothetical protein